jgi:hypothetical protein
VAKLLSVVVLPSEVSHADPGSCRLRVGLDDPTWSTKGVPLLASASVQGVGSTVTVDCMTVTEDEPLVYTALQALTCSVIVMREPAAPSRMAVKAVNSTIASWPSILSPNSNRTNR